MLVLIGIGLAAGFITAISPCVLPVLPIVFAGGATGSRRKPFAIIAGLIVSFTAFTLFGVWLLKKLGLPEDLLRNIAIALLFLVAATLLFPKVEELVQRPFLRLTRRPGGDLGGGFLLGASLGLVFVPCAGPVLAAISVVGATQDVGFRAIVLTLAYATGAAIPMLLVAFGGRAGMKVLRPHAHRIRQALGVLVALTALAIALNVDRHFQTAIPGYTESLQKKVEQSGRAQHELQKLRGATQVSNTTLHDAGPAPELAGLTDWINSKPLTLEQLRGKVVLVDFWTYSCINCLRTLPHVKAWYRTYRKDGLVVIGVHTPEFAFEHVPSNVRGAVRRLGIAYPVALDNDYKTWDAFQNQYWPAKYLIDRRGHIRFVHFGEGEYDTTESRIRTLLGENAGMLPVSHELADPTPKGLMTPESYLGYQRLARFSDRSITPDRFAAYHFPSRDLQENELSYSGRWRVGPEDIVAGPGARLRLNFLAQSVHLVLGGHGTVRVLLDGRPVRTVRVDGSRLYTLLERQTAQKGLLELRFTPGVRGYAFTFG
ncbi:MAG TPA: cytochrome c biogenesis protein DipZ, partial [Gaiellaceae bacterium]|jgi:cytochrome c biogenesis protein CcdA/thiol-disulfide isomerase/thioredoxin